MTVEIIFSFHRDVVVFRCADGCTRLVHTPSGTVMIRCPHPNNVPQLTHEFAIEAIKRSVALLG